MDISLAKAPDGYHIISGHRRLAAALSIRDEVLVTAPGIGEILILKRPDGGLVATQDTSTVALWIE